MSLGVVLVSEKLREGILRWFGHVLRRQPFDAVKRVESIIADDARRRGRPRRKWLDCLRSDLKDLTITEDMTSYRKERSKVYYSQVLFEFHIVVAFGAAKLHGAMIWRKNENFYMIGRNKSKTYWRVLKIDRLDPLDLNIREDSTNYTEFQCSELLRRIHEGNKPTGGLKFVTACYGIVGFIKFLGPYYMLLITKRKRIGAICGHNVYAVSKSEIILLPNSTVNPGISDVRNENRYKKLLGMVDLTKDFFFSYSYHVMHSLQKNLCNNERGQDDEKSTLRDISNTLPILKMIEHRPCFNHVSKEDPMKGMIQKQEIDVLSCKDKFLCNLEMKLPLSILQIGQDSPPTLMMIQRNTNECQEHIPSRMNNMEMKCTTSVDLGTNHIKEGGNDVIPISPNFRLDLIKSLKFTKADSKGVLPYFILYLLIYALYFIIYVNLISGA
ncbi:hypothetical protein F3Y22_tig00117048pilonHSYRG01160 [Hibiscus syriacus]|uniref:SAC domain-containing protein n=1 Tax=Hibiscus syriacus TaxID=106335 RepID=A0A6A2WY69_HIBSY|nr:hypothetical protein F3Y22_tig00117048pilonHSYRG01160 [Hibiscus syriacus]